MCATTSKPPTATGQPLQPRFPAVDRAKAGVFKHLLRLIIPAYRSPEIEFHHKGTKLTIPIRIITYSLNIVGISTGPTSIRHTAILFDGQCYEIVGNVKAGYRCQRNDNLSSQGERSRCLVRIEGINAEVEHILLQELNANTRITSIQRHCVDYQFKKDRSNRPCKTLEIHVRTESHVAAVIERLQTIRETYDQKLRIKSGEQILSRMNAKHGQKEVTRCTEAGVPPAIDSNMKLVRDFVVGRVEVSDSDVVHTILEDMMGPYTYNLIDNNCVHGSLHLYHAIEDRGMCMRDPVGYKDLGSLNFRLTEKGFSNECSTV